MGFRPISSFPISCEYDLPLLRPILRKRDICLSGAATPPRRTSKEGNKRRVARLAGDSVTRLTSMRTVGRTRHLRVRNLRNGYSDFRLPVWFHWGPA
jgi:hypothetical protein